jgi:hypothetical protein
MATEEKKKICFVISPIGEESSEIRERSDQVLKHIINEAVERLGYTVIRADKISEPGIITTQIIEHIVSADLVIADLTDKNPNVFYELAIRHAIRKPLIQMIKKGEIIPFDVAATRIIQFDLHSLDSVAYAKNEIVSQINSLESGTETHNPISVSLDLKVLKESGNIEERSLADIVEAISDLRLAISSIDKNVSSAKILEQLDNLPNKVLHKLEDYQGLRRRRKRFHPILFEELYHIEKVGNKDVGFLIMISFFRDDFPWLYEIGFETYRGLKSFKTIPQKIQLLKTFEQAVELLDHPIHWEMYGKSEDSYMFVKEARHFIHRYLDRYLIAEEKKKMK